AAEPSSSTRDASSPTGQRRTYASALPITAQLRSASHRPMRIWSGRRWSGSPQLRLSRQSARSTDICSFGRCRRAACRSLPRSRRPSVSLRSPSRRSTWSAASSTMSSGRSRRRIRETAMLDSLKRTWIITKREFGAYFATPLALVFLIIFVALTGAFAFYVGNFFDRNQADLTSFFVYHPWLFLLLVPAVAMRLWAEERKTGTIELLMTLPISPSDAILGKFLAAWAVIGVALVLTFPMWITVNVLATPDNGVILTSYVGSFLTAGAFLAIGSCVSALTKNQVIAFIVAAAVCFLLLMSGVDMVLNAFRVWAPQF